MKDHRRARIRSASIVVRRVAGGAAFLAAALVAAALLGAAPLHAAGHPPYEPELPPPVLSGQVPAAVPTFPVFYSGVQQRPFFDVFAWRSRGTASCSPG